MDKKQITENLICESFKNLLLKHPFDKITIKMITDEAGVIRPTFYNYFQDKYELLEWFIKNDLMGSVDDLIGSNMEKEAIKFIFVRFEKSKDFYKNIFSIQGQNSFESILTVNIADMFNNILSRHNVINNHDLNLLTIKNISLYYTNGFVYLIKYWIETNCSMSADDMFEAYIYLVSHSLNEMLHN